MRGVVISLLAAAALLAQQGSSALEDAAARLQKGDAHGAVSLLQPVVRAAPSDFKALTLYGMALGAANRMREANDSLRAALAVNPQFAPALRALAMNEMAMGLARNAKAHFEALLKLSPNEPMAHLALGEIAYAEKRYRSVVEHFEQSGGLYERDPANIVKYASACVNTDQPRKAAMALVALEASGHGDRYLIGYNLALAQMKSGDPMAAVKTCERMIAAGVRKAELQNLLSQAYERAGRTKDAYDALRQATEIDPADEVNYIDLVALCLDHKNFDLALEIADVGLKRLPGSDRLHLQRGVVWAMKGQLPEARTAFEKATKLAPAKSLPQVALGLVLLQMDKPAEALAVLRRRVVAAKDDYLALWFLGEAINRSGAEPETADAREGIEALRRAVRLNPNVAQPRVVLAKMLARTDTGLSEAAVQLERALRLEPDHVAGIYQLAQVLAKRGQTERSRALFARVSKAKAEERDQFASKGLAQIVREGQR